MTHVNSVARGVTASELNPYQRLPILRGGQRTGFGLLTAMVGQGVVNTAAAANLPWSSDA